MSKPILGHNGPELMVTTVIESSHCTLDLFPSLCCCSWGVQHIFADMEHWLWEAGRSDIQVCQKSHHPYFHVYCFFFFSPAFLLGLLLPCWYEQFIKIVLKEILRCVPSGVGHLLYSTCLNGAEIMRISSCKLETLHIIGVLRCIISFSPWIFVLSETWHSTLPF